MPRNLHLALTLILLVFPIVTPAQTPAKETVLFDFEGGHFDGWTLSGNCFAKQPATAKTFVDRQGNPLVSGIVEPVT